MGWRAGRYYVNSATGMSRDALDASGLGVGADGALTGEEHHRVFGVDAVAGRVSLRAILQQTLGVNKSHANEIISNTFLPIAREARGVPYWTREQIEREVAQHKTRAQTSPENGRTGGRKKRA
jgi:hypothetical protein